MKKVSVTVQYDEEKLDTVKIFLEKKGLTLSEEIVKFIDGLYNKNVPAQVREFLELKRSSQKESAPKQNAKPRTRSDVNGNNQS
jgi:hypothetical protein